MNRRHFLSLIGSGSALVLAGCTGENGEPDDDSGGDSGDETGSEGERNNTTESASNRTSDSENTGEEIDIEFDHPESLRLDEQFSLDISGLPPDPVEIRASLVGFNNTEWTASATYETDDEALALDTAVPLDAEFDAGTMNLVQWARSDEEGRYAPHWENGDELTVEVRTETETSASTTIDRTFSDIASDRVESDDFVGWVAEPAGDDPVPGVIVLHGSGGQPDRGVGHMLASRGFVTLTLQYFDGTGSHDDLPSELAEVPLEYVENGADWLLDHDRVDSSQIGVWGPSKGGELALLAGSRLETIGAVVSLNGSGYVWADPMEINRGSSWTYDGEPIPYVPYTTDSDIWDDQSSPRELEPMYTASVEEADEETLTDATIAVERIDGPVLLVSGGDDRMWNSVELHTVAADRLDRNDSQFNHLVYEDAGHAIRYPYLPATNREEDSVYVYGGSTAGYAEADADHWPQVVELFETLQSE